MGPVRMISSGHELTTDYDEKTLHELGFKDMQVTARFLSARYFHWMPKTDRTSGFVRSWKTWKSHGILKMVISRPGKVMEKNLNCKSFGKVIEICYNHMFIYTEFEILYTFFKERRSKYKPAYALNTQHFLNFSCSYRDFSLVMDIFI